MFVTILEKKSTAMPFIKPVWITPTRIEQFCCFMCQWSVFCFFRVCYFLQWVKNYSWLQSNGSTWEFKTFDDLIRRVGIRRRLKNTSSFNRSTIVWYLLILIIETKVVTLDLEHLRIADLLWLQIFKDSYLREKTKTEWILDICANLEKIKESMSSIINHTISNVKNNRIMTEFLFLLLFSISLNHHSIKVRLPWKLWK